MEQASVQSPLESPTQEPEATPLANSTLTEETGTTAPESLSYGFSFGFASHSLRPTAPAAIAVEEQSQGGLAEGDAPPVTPQVAPAQRLSNAFFGLSPKRKAELTAAVEAEQSAQTEAVPTESVVSETVSTEAAATATDTASSNPVPAKTRAPKVAAPSDSTPGDAAQSTTPQSTTPQSTTTDAVNTGGESNADPA